GRVQPVAGADGNKDAGRVGTDGCAGLPRRTRRGGRRDRRGGLRHRVQRLARDGGALVSTSDRRQAVGEMSRTQGNDPRLDRREAMREQLDNRVDMLVVTGLGSTTWDAAAVGEDERNFYLWGAMGAAAMVGLGLAIAQPERRVLVVTGDGEMLMGLGALATIGVERPPNLALVVFDNGHYGETGMQASHTDSSVSLCGVARACGIGEVLDITDAAALKKLAARLPNFDRTIFARIA